MINKKKKNNSNLTPEQKRRRALYIAMLIMLGFSYKHAVDKKTNREINKVMEGTQLYDGLSLITNNDVYLNSEIKVSVDANLDEIPAYEKLDSLLEYNNASKNTNIGYNTAIELVNIALNENHSLTVQEKDAIRDWTIKINTVNPEFDFRILANNLKTLKIDCVDEKIKNAEKKTVYMPAMNTLYIPKYISSNILDNVEEAFGRNATSSTDEAYRAEIEGALYYIATEAIIDNKTYTFGCNEIKYNESNACFGRGIQEMYKSSFNVDINGYYAPIEDSKLLYDFAYILKQIYGTQEFYNVYSNGDINDFIKLLETNMDEVDAKTFVAAIDTIYVDQNTNKLLDGDLRRTYIEYITNELLAAYSKRIVTLLKDNIDNDLIVSEEYIDLNLEVNKNNMTEMFNLINVDAQMNENYMGYIEYRLYEIHTDARIQLNNALQEHKKGAIK